MYGSDSSCWSGHLFRRSCSSRILYAPWATRMNTVGVRGRKFSTSPKPISNGATGLQASERSSMACCSVP